MAQDNGLGDMGLSALFERKNYYEQQVEAESKAARASGGTGANQFDEAAQEFSQKEIAANNEIQDRLWDIHTDRSEYAQKQDEARRAEKADTPMQWASDPNSYDWPGIDTPR